MTHDTVGIEISELRKRLRATIEQSRQAAVARRAAIDHAAKAYEELLSTVAEPMVQKLASALRAEGFPFMVFTPKGGLRLVSNRSSDDFIEFALDTGGLQPVAILRVNRGRGRRVLQHERPIRGEERIDQLTEEDVLTALLEELTPFLEK